MTGKFSSLRKYCTAILAVVLFAAFGLRLFLALQDTSYEVDISCFKAWASATSYYGWSKMYHVDMFLDYPPGYMYVLSLLELVRASFSLPYESPVYTCIIKMPAMLADIFTAYWIYRLAAKHMDRQRGLLLAAAFAFCPAVVYNSSVWGQIDSIFTLLILLTLYAAYEKRTVKTAVYYALALLIKPQALLFGPILLFYIIELRSLKELGKALGTGLAVMYLLTLPFADSISPAWLIKLYMGSFSGYQYFTVNGYNLYMLFDMNWKSLDSAAWSWLINPMVIGAGILWCGRGYFRGSAFGFVKNNDSAGIADRSRMFSSALMFLMIFFAFATMMHERYLYPAVALALLSYLLTAIRTIWRCLSSPAY